MEDGMKRMLAAVAGVALVVILAPRALAQTPDEIVEKHLAAMGGRAALAKLTSQVASGTIAIQAQGADLGGTIEISKKAPNKSRTLMRIDLASVGGSEMVVDQRCDGKTAFASNSLQGDREITGPQLQNMLNASFPSSLLNYKETGAKIELLGRETAGAKPVLVLQYTPASGPALKLYLDANTYLVSRTVVKLSLPEAGGDIEQSTDVTDYRAIDGVQTPFSVSITGAGQAITITLAKVEYNVALDDAVFSRPGVK
jgi:hypothetical protein